MRKSLILLPLLFAATPALAKPPASQLPPEFSDPKIVDRLDRSMQVMSKALMDLHVGELQAALEGRAATAADKARTVRDLSQVNEAELQQRIANARPMIDSSIKALNESLPAMLRSMDKVRQAVDRAAANMPDPTYPKR